MTSSTSIKQKKDIRKAGNFRRGNYTLEEKPSDSAGIWKGKERSLNELRLKAWKNN